MSAVTFLIQMKDMVSSRLNTVAREFQRTRTSADTLVRSIDTLRVRGEHLRVARDTATSRARIRGLNRELGRTERQIARIENMGRGGFLRNITNAIPGGNMFLNPATIAAVGIGAVAKLGMENQKTAISFEVLLQSEEKAKNMLKELNQYASKTTYGESDVYKATQMMLGFEISQEKVMGNLAMLGDIAMGDKNRLNSLTLAFSQVQAAGKLTGQDLLQMINVGFNPLGEISKVTGKSMSELKDEMRKGAISSGMVSEAFKIATSEGGRFFGMTDKIGKTGFGKLTTLIDSAKRRLIELYDILEPLLIPTFESAGFILKGLSLVIVSIASSVKWWIDGIKEANPMVIGLTVATAGLTYAFLSNIIATKSGAIAQAVATGATYVATAAQWAFNAAMNANPIGLIITAIGLLAVGIAYLVENIENLDEIWDSSIAGMKAQFSMFIDTFMFGVDKALIGWYKFKNALGIGDEIENNAMISQLNADVEQRKKLIAESLSIINENMNMEIKWKDDDASESSINKPLSADGLASSSAVNKGTKTIASGGTRNTSINIRVDKQIEQVVFQGSLEENKEGLKNKLMEIMNEALFAAQTAM